MQARRDTAIRINNLPTLHSHCASNVSTQRLAILPSFTLVLCFNVAQLWGDLLMSSDLRFGVVILVFARDQLFLVSLFEGLNLGEPPTKKRTLRCSTFLRVTRLLDRVN